MKKESSPASITGTPEYALRMIETGYRFVTMASDARFMAAAAKSALAGLRGGMPAPGSAGGTY